MVDTVTIEAVRAGEAVQAGPQVPAAAPTTDRRRPGRMENPSPELIALMRRPTPEAEADVALYDAPHFVPPAQDSFALPNPWHLSRMVGAAGLCVAGWAGAVGLMVAVWG